MAPQGSIQSRSSPVVFAGCLAPGYAEVASAGSPARPPLPFPCLSISPSLSPSPSPAQEPSLLPSLYLGLPQLGVQAQAAVSPDASAPKQDQEPRAADSEGSAAAQVDGHNNTIESPSGAVYNRPSGYRIAAASAAISGFLVPPRPFTGVPKQAHEPGGAHTPEASMPAHGPDEVHTPEASMRETLSVVV